MKIVINMRPRLTWRRLYPEWVIVRQDIRETLLSLAGRSENSKTQGRDGFRGFRHFAEFAAFSCAAEHQRFPLSHSLFGSSSESRSLISILPSYRLSGQVKENSFIIWDITRDPLWLKDRKKNKKKKWMELKIVQYN